MVCDEADAIAVTRARERIVVRAMFKHMHAHARTGPPGQPARMHICPYACMRIQTILLAAYSTRLCMSIHYHATMCTCIVCVRLCDATRIDTRALHVC